MREQTSLCSESCPECVETVPILGLVQNRVFLGNSTDRLRALTGKVLGMRWGATVSGANEASVAEHFQPMRVRLTGQQLGRCLSHALGTLTSLQPPVIQEELQQRQVIRAQVPPEEEVTPKPTVEVLHQRTGPDRALGQRGHCGLDLVEPTAKSLAYGCFLGPAPRGALAACQNAEKSPEQFCGYLELLPQQLQLLIEHQREG